MLCILSAVFQLRALMYVLCAFVILNKDYLLTYNRLQSVNGLWHRTKHIKNNLLLFESNYLVYHYWHFLHSIRSKVYVTVRRPSVCLSVCPVAAAEEQLRRSQVAGDPAVARGRSMALSSKCGQCHVYSRVDAAALLNCFSYARQWRTESNCIGLISSVSF